MDVLQLWFPLKLAGFDFAANPLPAAHDGGALLGPLWETYGEAPNQNLEIGQVFTIEPGLAVPNYGYIGLEEDVLVTESGAQYFCEPQREIVLLKG